MKQFQYPGAYKNLPKNRLTASLVFHLDIQYSLHCRSKRVSILLTMLPWRCHHTENDMLVSCCVRDYFHFENHNIRAFGKFYSLAMINVGNWQELRGGGWMWGLRGWGVEEERGDRVLEERFINYPPVADPDGLSKLCWLDMVSLDRYTGWRRSDKIKGKDHEAWWLISDGAIGLIPLMSLGMAITWMIAWSQQLSLSPDWSCLSEKVWNSLRHARCGGHIATALVDVMLPPAAGQGYLLQKYHFIEPLILRLHGPCLTKEDGYRYLFGVA